MTNKQESDSGILSVRSSEIKPLDEKDTKCAPHLQFENGSCMPIDTLIMMAEVYNENFPSKIKMIPNLNTMNPQKYKRYLVKEFQKRLWELYLLFCFQFYNLACATHKPIPLSQALQLSL